VVLKTITGMAVVPCLASLREDNMIKKIGRRSLEAATGRSFHVWRAYAQGTLHSDDRRVNPVMAQEASMADENVMIERVN
jgi:hypothetical protein